MATVDELTAEVETLSDQLSGLVQVWQAAGAALDAVRARLAQARVELAAATAGTEVLSTAADAQAKVSAVDALLAAPVLSIGKGVKEQPLPAQPAPAG